MTDKKLNGSILKGVVSSIKMQKTIVVEVSRRVKHPLYAKIVTKTTKFHVHLPEGKSCNLEDVVTIQECPPISKTKRWVLLEVVESAAQVV